MCTACNGQGPFSSKLPGAPSQSLLTHSETERALSLCSRMCQLLEEAKQNQSPMRAFYVEQEKLHKSINKIASRRGQAKPKQRLHPLVAHGPARALSRHCLDLPVSSHGTYGTSFFLPSSWLLGLTPGQQPPPSPQLPDQRPVWHPG